MVEAMAQLGGIALLSDPRFSGYLPLFGGIDKARFRRQVVPGDTLEMTVELDQLGSNAGKGHGTATVAGRWRPRRRCCSSWPASDRRAGPDVRCPWRVRHGGMLDRQAEITLPRLSSPCHRAFTQMSRKLSALRPTLWKSPSTSRYTEPRLRPWPRRAQSAAEAPLEGRCGPRWARL